QNYQGRQPTTGDSRLGGSGASQRLHDNGVHPENGRDRTLEGFEGKHPGWLLVTLDCALSWARRRAKPLAVFCARVKNRRRPRRPGCRLLPKKPRSTLLRPTYIATPETRPCAPGN